MKYPRDGQILLIIDPSSASIGWNIAKLNKGEFKITHSGAILASSSWSLGRRLSYMHKGVKLLIETFGVNLIVSEEPMVARGMAGAAVVPSVVNIIKMLIWDLGDKVEFETLHVDKWRKLLCISGVPAFNKSGKMIVNKRGKQKKDFKVPTARKVEEILKFKLPEKVLDNSSLKMKPLKDDTSDSLAIGIAYAMSLNYPKITHSGDIFTNSETVKVTKILYTLK